MSFQFLSENYYNGAQWYEQFLQVSHLCEALILLGLALSLFWAPQCLRSSWTVVLYIVWRRHHNGLLLCKNNWAETTDIKVGQSSDVGLWVRPPGNSWPLIRWVCLCDLTHKCLRRGVRCYCLQQWILNCNSYVAVQIFCYISAV